GSLRRDGFTFTGFGRAAVDPEGEYSFSTVDPGPTEPGKAAFISVVIFARGLLNGLFTRIYLPEDTEALAADPLLSSLSPSERNRLIAARGADGSLRFDIRLQGEEEPPFLRFPGHADRHQRPPPPIPASSSPPAICAAPKPSMTTRSSPRSARSRRPGSSPRHGWGWCHRRYAPRSPRPLTRPSGR